MAHAGMLRASCESCDIQLDTTVVVNPEAPCGVEHAGELIEFADALLSRDRDRLDNARDRLRSLVGNDGVDRAAAVTGNFQMMNRALDAIGATFGDRLPTRVKEMADQFGIDPPAHW